MNLPALPARHRRRAAVTRRRSPRPWAASAILACAALAVAGLNAPSAAAAASQSVRPAAHAAPAAGHGHALKVAGRARGTARTVSLRQRVEAMQRNKPLTARRMTPRAGLTTPADLITPTGADVTSSFDGISVGPIQDLSSATNGSQIVQVAGPPFFGGHDGFLQVTDNNGAVQCGGGIPVSQLLGTADHLSSLGVIYDNRQGHFIVTASVGPESGSPVAMWVATSDSSNPCQFWHMVRLTFSGELFPPGEFLFPMKVGQDHRAVLVGAVSRTGFLVKPFDSHDAVFAITKSDLYAGNTISFPAFDTGDSNPAPVSNAGQPMIDSQFSYFLAAEPSIGYQLYQMTGSGTANPSVSLISTLGEPYDRPEAGLETARITSSPVYDGSRIWFVHGQGAASTGGSRTTLDYGYIDLTRNLVRDQLIDINPSLNEINGSVGVGLNTDGTEAIFLNWAYTDGVNGSDAVDSFVWNGGNFGGNPLVIGDQRQTLVTGSPLSEMLGSSVAVEPATFGDTTCAVTTQGYIVSNGGRSRLARICSPTTIGVPFIGVPGPIATTVPGLTTTTINQASAILARYDLSAGAQTFTASCDPATQDGTVVGTTPAFNQPVPLGSAVGLVICRAQVPNVIGETPANAVSDIEAAGLLYSGTTNHKFNCTAADAGTVIATDPAAGTFQPYHTFVTLTDCVPTPPAGTVPDLTGLTQAQASSALDAAGYTLGAVHFAIDDSCGLIGVVMDQSPAAGAQASPGTAVSITIGRKPKFCSP